MRIRMIFTTAAAGAALTLATGGTAFASIGPRAFLPASAGYEASGAQFRYVQDTVFADVPAAFAAFDDQVSWETELLGVTRSDGSPVSVDISIGGNPKTDKAYHAWANVNGTAVALQGNAEGLVGGQTYTESIYYNQDNGVVSVSAYNSNGSAFGQAFVGQGISFRNPRIVAGFDPGRSFTAPAAPVKLAAFTGITLTTYSGHRGDLIDWYSRDKVFATSDGTIAGHVRAAPTSLSGAGTALSVSLQP